MSSSARPGVVLRHRRLELVEVGEVLQRAGRLAGTERLVALHALAAAPVQVGPPGPQRLGELGHLAGEVHVLQRAGHQRGQLVALLGAQRPHHPLGRGGAAGERVDQLLEVRGAVREHVAVAGHELVELLLRVLAPRVGREHRVEVGHHVLDPLHRCGGGGFCCVFQRLLHPAELRVEHLAAQQVLHLLEGLRRLGGAPVVARRAGARRAPGRRQRVQRGLAEPRVVGGVGEERRPLLADRGVDQPPHLLQGAVEASALAHLPPLLAQPAHHVVQPAGSLPVPRRSRRRSASRGVAPDSTSSPSRSRARRTS